MSHDSFLSISQAARRKGVSRTTVYKYIDQGLLRSSLVMDRLAVRESELMALDMKQMKPGRPAGQSLSKRHRAAISEAQKKRWQKRRESDNQLPATKPGNL